MLFIFRHILGIRDEDPYGTNWIQIHGQSLKYVSVSSHDGSVWGISPSNTVYKREDIS